MKRLTIFTVLMLSAIALAAGSVRWSGLSMALTGVAPTLDTDGLALSMSQNGVGNIRGWRATCRAEPGQTLTGGNVRVWLYSYATGLWGENRELGVTIPPAYGKRQISWPDVEVHIPMGRVVLRPDAVTVSGGTTVDCFVEAWTW